MITVQTPVGHQALCWLGRSLGVLSTALVEISRRKAFACLQGIFLALTCLTGRAGLLPPLKPPVGEAEAVVADQLL